MFKKKISILLAIVLCFTALTACSQKELAENKVSNAGSNNQSASSQTGSHYPLELTIYDNKGNELQQSIKKEPERIIVIGQGLAELIIHFEEEKRIVGLAYLDQSYSKYKAQINQLPLLTDMWPSKESIITLKPDFIVAMSSAFTDERLGDISFWNERGIPVLTGINYTVGRTIDSFLMILIILGWH
jgi:iron complex transport system substrate-binding protein